MVGMSRRDFMALVPVFKAAEKEALRGKARKRAPGAGGKPVLSTVMDRLMFILVYFKMYPTQDLLGVLFGQSQPWANKWVHCLTPYLEAGLGRKMALPLRPATATLQELVARCPEMIFVLDGTERPIERPKDDQKQKANYSGKKKRHTHKKLIVSSQHTKKIVVMGETEPGSTHDKKALDKSGLAFPGGSVVYEDKGFVGHVEPGVLLVRPKKKPKGAELSDADRACNQEISSLRVVVEHSIRGMKIFRISKEVYRNRKEGFEDRSMRCSGGLYNHRVSQAMRLAA
jgi:hypothetical protein